ncbi:MAG: hypothetical protein HKN67_01080 [Saprospiraceae bacterium]|nr:PorT family protein [Bacteroidia bacterium]MBT8228919.1 PorT family protein [Bacteroidia bacterium]NNF20505.1 hypothetical protein [Saprospiraceae bacterium]NNK89463.1 hypothetical protein [Saprospiraceae bacterium]
MRKIIFTFFIVFLFVSQGSAQDGGFYFGPKAGLTIATQNWNEAERKPLLNYHFAAFIESIDYKYKGSLFAQIGYHTRGSSIFVSNINNGLRFSEGYKFRNISLLLGAKKRLITEKLTTPYYFFGVRAEYLVSDNLDEIQDLFSNSPSALFYPIDVYTNTFVYGVSFGGGIEYLGSAYVQPTLEVTFSPDFSFQYQSPEIPNVVSPYDGRTTTIPERRIRNITFEVSLVVRFLREVIYTD